MWVLKHNGMSSIKITCIHLRTRSLHPATEYTMPQPEDHQINPNVLLRCRTALVRQGQSDTGTHNAHTIFRPFPVSNRNRVPESSLPKMRVKTYVCTQNVHYCFCKSTVVICLRICFIQVQLDVLYSLFIS
jgi:hypothetical protein